MIKKVGLTSSNKILYEKVLEKFPPVLRYFFIFCDLIHHIYFPVTSFHFFLFLNRVISRTGNELQRNKLLFFLV